MVIKMKKNKHIQIGNFKMGEGKPVFIIAEAGVNHNGSLKRAKQLVDAAKEADADAVKFQTFITEEVLTVNAPKANYQKKSVPGKSQFKMIKNLELSQFHFMELSQYCKKKNIMFLSTPFDTRSAELLNEIGVPAFKISSGELTNIGLLVQIAKYHKPMILSTGMSTLHEIKKAVTSIYSVGNVDLVLLHCVSNYPASFEDVNLRAIPTLANKFKPAVIGYSDHTLGIEAAIAAVAMGAKVIEKHFTLDKDLPGPDHKTSIDPVELKQMIFAIRNIENALGDGIKKVRDSEIEIRRVARKSIVAAKDIKRGARITLEMLAVKRPGHGIEPNKINALIGNVAKRNINKDSLLDWADML